MTFILDRQSSTAQLISTAVIDFLEEGGFSDPRQNIPGLAAAIVRLSLQTDNPQQALDEVVTLLDDEV